MTPSTRFLRFPAFRPTVFPELLLLSLLLGPLATAAAHGSDPPFLVRDIETTGEPYAEPCILSVCPPPVLVHGAVLGQLTGIAGQLLFVAHDRVHGFEPWISDGTEAGTRLLQDLRPGPEGSAPTVLGQVGDVALFWGDDGQAYRLWATGGTPAPPQPIAMPCDPSCAAGDELSLVFGGERFFQAYDGLLQHYRLYRSDGGMAHEVADLCPDRFGFCLRRIDEMFVWNDALLYSPWFPGHPRRWYRLATPTGTPQEITPHCALTGERLVRGTELWVVGTCPQVGPDLLLFALDQPTSQPRVIWTFAATGPQALTAWGDARAVFELDDRLWTTDGTSAGTGPLESPDSVTWTQGLGDALLVAGHQAGEPGLWSLTEAGGLEELATVLPTRVSGPVAGRAFLAAGDESTGQELWVTDATAAGTHLVADLAPGPGSSNPAWGGLSAAGFEPAGDLVYFGADDGAHDIELWAVAAEAVAPSCVPDPHSLCLFESRFRVEVTWTDFVGRTGAGTAVPLTPDTGAMWFFWPDNLELMVKVIDGRGYNGHFWVFFGALSNVAFDLVVTDTANGRQWIRSNPLHEFASVGDIKAFPGE